MDRKLVCIRGLVKVRIFLVVWMNLRLVKDLLGLKINIGIIR